MRIAYLSTAVLPSRLANSVHVMKMCRALAGEGHQVLLLAPDRPGTERGVDDVHGFYGVERSFEIEKCAWPAFPGKSYLCAYRMARRARRFGADLVYGRFLHGCYLAARSGLPVVYETHAPGTGAGPVARRMHVGLLRSPRLSHVVVISEALRRMHLAEGLIAPGRVVVAHDAADPMPADSVPEPIAGDGLRIGYVGHLYAGRGVELILHLAASCPWAHFHLVGGTDADVAEWRARSSGRTNLTFHGFLPPNRLDAYRLALDVLLAPYERTVTIQGEGDTSRWMSPLKIFEYMAAGKAIVCSDLPVLHEVLTHERTALLCDPDEPEAWVGALERLHREPDLRAALGARARVEFEAEHTWAARARRVLHCG